MMGKLMSDLSSIKVLVVQGPYDVIRANIDLFLYTDFAHILPESISPYIKQVEVIRGPGDTGYLILVTYSKHVKKVLEAIEALNESLEKGELRVIPEGKIFIN